MELSGWGRYPRMDVQTSQPTSLTHCAEILLNAKSLIPRGLGRSYGDSALAGQVLLTKQLNHFITFDDAEGLLTCEAGVSLSDILETFVPRGWFLPVTPGTRFVTVGGAIASDVHGKNHHLVGTFGQSVRRIEILLGNGTRVEASPDVHAELFNATCGGMGLTGIILAAELQLQRVKSNYMEQTTQKCPDLDSVLEAFESNNTRSYTVAWIDCLAKGLHLGRSLFFSGEHARDASLDPQSKATFHVPCDMPASLLNRHSVRAFNFLYYQRIRRVRLTQQVPIKSFFYPLDKLSHWNRLYGRQGFLQHQFVLPKSMGLLGLRSILQAIAESGLGSFLAVLKVFGPANQHFLSFPEEGYTLALDFKAEPAAFELLDTLDKIVLEYGGRIYLAKDARMTETMFKSTYPNWQRFEEVRAQWHAHGHFASAQSRRLGLL